MRDRLTLRLQEQSQIADARRRVVALANFLDFDETQRAKVALVVTEMATNLVKHVPHGGQLLVWGIVEQDMTGLEILSLDGGPGIESVRRALQNGYSTVGSPGTGLGAIQRQAAFFDIYSRPHQGTAMLVHLWAKPGSPRQPSQRRLILDGIHVAKPGQDVSGDAWAVSYRPDGALLLLADGLGHGPDAALAAGEAVKAFYRQHRRPPAQILEAIHRELSNTRGAAVAVAHVALDTKQVTYAGIGNISTLLLAPDGRRQLVSYNGTVGHLIHKIREFNYPWSEETVMVMHSDGLNTRWSLDAYPGLARRHPALIAGVLYRDFRRGNDDVAIVVARSLQ